MKPKNTPIVKSRREYFGGIIFRERPAFLAHVNKSHADAYRLTETKGAIMRKDILTAPLDAHFAITTRCNKYCKGCYSTGREDEAKDIPLAKAKAVIDKLAELGVFSLSFGGGEPALHPELFEIADYARSKNILPNMTSNGLNMTEQFANNCSVFGNVHFSIHTPKDKEHIFEAARVYSKATRKKPGLNLLLTRETLPELDEILRMAKKSGIHKVLFLRYKTTAKNTGSGELCIDNEIEGLPMHFINLKRANKRLMFLIDCSLFQIFAEHGFSNTAAYFKYDTNGCMGANAYIAIDVDAMYKPCSFWHETFGDILKLDFETWINNPKLNEFRNVRRDVYCTQCDYEELCNGGCRMLYHIPCHHFR